MKRSEINRILRDIGGFLKVRQFHLPPFAFWTPYVWATKGAEASEIVDRRLGWDITDFGSGDYKRIGLAHFTIRNGTPDSMRTGRGKLYCEKILIVEPDQATPCHFHYAKMEDIINRGGGDLVVRLWNSTKAGTLADTGITVSTDGMERALAAGDTVTLGPGESITLPPGLYHTFWGTGARVLVGEVSLVNDDHNDNHFLESVGRFPEIEEDEAPLYPLIQDYALYYKGNR